MTEEAERLTCPRRPFDCPEKPDRWRLDRWDADRAEAERKKAEYEAKHPGSHAASHHWGGPGPLPRTCSYCGGIHPEDAITLLEAGWEVEPTGKDYKRYINPPGTLAHHNATMDFLQGRREDEPPPHWMPTPPVKFYTPHLESQEQCDRFNAALMESRRKARG